MCKKWPSLETQEYVSPFGQPRQSATPHWLQNFLMKQKWSGIRSDRQSIDQVLIISHRTCGLGRLRAETCSLDQNVSRARPSLAEWSRYLGFWSGILEDQFRLISSIFTTMIYLAKCMKLENKRLPGGNLCGGRRIKLSRTRRTISNDVFHTATWHQ